MMKVLVKPVNGATLVDPLSNRMVPEGGLRVRLDNYFRRRIADGDAVIVEEKSSNRKPIKLPSETNEDLDKANKNKEDK